MSLTALKPTPIEFAQHSEIRFMDRLLASWSLWARSDMLRTRVRSLALYASELDAGRVRSLDCDDDQFTRVDQQVAHLPSPLSRVIFAEYLRRGPSAMKASMCHLTRHNYRQTLQAGQWVLYSMLMPDVENWRQSVL